jgi:hypothetical protein
MNYRYLNECHLEGETRDRPQKTRSRKPHSSLLGDDVDRLQRLDATAIAETNVSTPLAVCERVGFKDRLVDCSRTPFEAVGHHRRQKGPGSGPSNAALTARRGTPPLPNFAGNHALGYGPPKTRSAWSSRLDRTGRGSKSGDPASCARGPRTKGCPSACRWWRAPGATTCRSRWRRDRDGLWAIPWTLSPGQESRYPNVTRFSSLCSCQIRSRTDGGAGFFLTRSTHTG